MTAKLGFTLKRMIKKGKNLFEYPVVYQIDLLDGALPQTLIPFCLDWFDRLTIQQKRNQKKSRLNPLRSKNQRSTAKIFRNYRFIGYE